MTYYYDFFIQISSVRFFVDILKASCLALIECDFFGLGWVLGTAEETAANVLASIIPYFR